MSINSKPPFKLAIIASSIMIGIGIALAIVLDILVSLSSGSSEARMALVTIIGAAIVVPILLLTLNIVGLFIYEKSKYISIIFGIATSLIYTFLLALALVRGTITIFEGIYNFEYFVFYMIIMGLAYAFAGINIF
jgi:hypothetical protein